MGKIDLGYELDDRYRSVAPDRPGRVYLTGTQALVRMVLAQAERDRAAGLDTAGFVSGYRGSPLGAVDQEMWRAEKHLAAARVRFQPAINEDLAATAVLGTQKVETDTDRTVQGVFALWYGKGPGVDRSGDVLKHGNAYGSSPHGGVLVVAGDDHGCVSSSMSHQSDLAMIAWGMPVLHPAAIAEYEPFGLWGWAASRASGAWVGFKAISETVEGASSVPVGPVPPYAAAQIDPGPDGLHWRWPDLPGTQLERRLAHKLAAVTAFARANPIDTLTVAAPRTRLLIAAVGKAHGDVMEALTLGGLTPAMLAAAGVSVLKVGLVHPLSPMLADLAATAEEVLVVEEKAGVVEGLLKAHLFNAPGRPRVLGKSDAAGAPLIPSDIELRPSRIAKVLAASLGPFGLGLALAGAAPSAAVPGLPSRTPYFCSGCPHNTSTRVPEGSRAQAGIGCHFMAGWMDRSTSGIVQMGGEGVDWVGQAPFVKTPHVFQNLGDGTFFHSGLLAIRQAIAAKADITYKVLFNDAVAMTGGQPVDGTMTVAQITRVAAAEGAARVVVVADDPGKYGASPGFASGVALHHRDELDAVQRTLREVKGVTVLVYDQVCATEARRRRKRGTAAKPATRVVINDLVCEGCGDCQAKSNCLSVVPVETPFGRKRAIDQGSCNTDLSCLKGFCPSFVTLEGGTLRKGAGPAVAADTVLARAAALPEPEIALGERPYEVLVAGVGGTGIVTVGALMTMAAHLCGQGATVLDFTGFAQKGGQVLSHVKLARSPEMLHQVRIDRGRADAILAADLVVATGAEALAAIDPARTRILANTKEMQTGTTLRDPDAKIDMALLQSLLRRRVGAGAMHGIDAPRMAERLLGDPITSNILLLGMAWQLGLVPLPRAALDRAIELNAVAVGANRLAFAWGRLAAGDAAYVAQHMAEPADTLDPVERRAAFLAEYQDLRYAERYRRRVAAVAALGDPALTDAVARNLFKVMAIKDEYEVARLHTGTGFLERELGRYQEAPRVRFHLAPPVLSRTGPDGHPLKRTFGPWMITGFRVLSSLRRLRGTPLDVFGMTAERRRERALRAEYEAMLDGLPDQAVPESLPILRELAALPEGIRGFGHVRTGAMEKAAVKRAELMSRLAGGTALEHDRTRPLDLVDEAPPEYRAG